MLQSPLLSFSFLKLFCFPPHQLVFYLQHPNSNPNPFVLAGREILLGYPDSLEISLFFEAFSNLPRPKLVTNFPSFLQKISNVINYMFLYYSLSHSRKDFQQRKEVLIHMLQVLTHFSI